MVIRFWWEGYYDVKRWSKKGVKSIIRSCECGSPLMIVLAMCINKIE